MASPESACLGSSAKSPQPDEPLAHSSVSQSPWRISVHLGSLNNRTKGFRTIENHIRNKQSKSSEELNS
eukprot:9490166-Pyramimonas_sp.AAC.1